MTDSAKRAAQTIKDKTEHFTPDIGIVLGSGLGEFVDQIENPYVIPYQELEGFHVPQVLGHQGRLYLGTMCGVKIACLQGRAHLYEGVATEAIRTMVRTLKLIGCSSFLATNASGSLRKNMKPGSLVLLRDHINFQFQNPLIGSNAEEFGPRFMSMDAVYDMSFRQQLKKLAQKLQIKLHEGVYISVLGPSFETPAEIRVFQVIGADLVGMSTVPEVIVARHCGMRVAVVSVVTNMAAGMHDRPLTHEETLRGAKLGVGQLIQLLKAFMDDYEHKTY